MTEEAKGTAETNTGDKVEAKQTTDKPEEKKSEAPKTKARPKAKKATSNSAAGIGAFAWLLIIISLLVAVAAVGGNYYLWQQTQQQARQLAEARADQSQGLSKLEGRNSQLEQRLSGTDEAMSKLQRRDATIESSLENIYKQLGQDRASWTLDEVDYLLVIANRRLQLDQDVKSALTALDEADRSLEAQADPALLPVREAIASEVQALRALPVVDTEGMALELASLAQGVEKLPLPGDNQQHFQIRESETLKRPAETWQGVLKAMWNDIKGLVSIRNTGVEAMPLRVPEQRYYLRQNLILKLESARLALLQQSEATFQHTLDEAAIWTERYFNREDSATQSFLESIKRLKGTRLKLELPNIDASLRSLRQVRKRLEREAQQAIKQSVEDSAP